MTKSAFYNGDNLLEAASDFELVIKSGEKYCDSSNRLSRLLSLLFAMRSAFTVCSSFVRMGGELPGPAKDGVAAGGFDSLEQEPLPTFNAVKKATEAVVAAVASNDWPVVRDSLAAMGVFTLCPSLLDQLSRMEGLAGNVSGRARLVFLIELALFAFELGDFNATRRYVKEAWSLDPSAWEMYTLCILEGLFAVAAGNSREAIRWLEKSINACQTDEHTSLYCGIRPPDFLLVQRLFERGERVAVLKHLAECKNVWQLPRMPMGTWIDLIERGEAPDFQEAGFAKGMSLPSCRLSLQWMRTRSLEAAKGPSPASPMPKSPAEVVEARKKLREDSERYISAKVTDAISYLDKGLAAPPDRPPSNPADPPLPSSPEPEA